MLDLGTRCRWVGKSHLIGDGVGPLDEVVERKIPSPHQESNPRTPIVQPDDDDDDDDDYSSSSSSSNLRREMSWSWS